MLANFVHPRRLGQVLFEAGYLFSKNPPTLRGPDVSFASDRSRISPDRFIEGASDLAVISPSKPPRT